MSDFDQVELRVTTEVNGRKVQTRALANLELWNEGSEYQDRPKNLREMPAQAGGLAEQLPM